jgi:hypothetical protein
VTSKKKLHKAADKALDRAIQAERRAAGLAHDVARLQARIDDMTRHWRPVPIAHEWQPTNPECMFCDEPRDAARHQPYAIEAARAASHDNGS